MSWVTFLIVGIILLFILYIFLSRHNKKTASTDTTIIQDPKESHKNTGDTGVEKIDEEPPEHNVLPVTQVFQDKHNPETRKSISKETMPYANIGKITKHPSSKDWQQWHIESIHSPFPEEFTPARTLLHEAYELEKKGVPSAEIEKILEKAREVDPNAVSFYQGRMEIIRGKHHNQH